MFEGTKKNIHILGITESHANKHLLDDQVSITDYSLVRKDRESGQGGGVLLLYKKLYLLATEN
jgi:hypothetical protein